MRKKNPAMITRMISYTLLVMLLLPITIAAQTKRALVIGLGEQEDPAWNKINGDKDVPYVMELLEEAHYTQILTCVNRQATKAGIVKAFKTLEEACRANDLVYVHFSGHGQQMRDSGRDETDGLDECWIPYDAYRKPCSKDRGEKHLTDDEVNGLLTGIYSKVGKGGKLVVVIDACHSGDATRSPEETVRGVADVFETMKSWLGMTEDADKGIRPNWEPWITLSACESDQVNIEMRQPKVGKLTYALYTTLKRGTPGGNTAFFRSLSRFVNSNTASRPQKPVMTGEGIEIYDITDLFK